MGVANVGTDSCLVYLNDHMIKVFVKGRLQCTLIKKVLINVHCNLPFLSIVWCSESARMYDHIICGRASVHFKLICSCTCTCIRKEDTCTCISKRSILFFFALCIIWMLLKQLNIKCLHVHVQCLHVHTRGVPTPVAQSVECVLRET